MRKLWLGLGLPAKLLVLTLLFVMLAEVLIFVPSVANYRVKWLTDRLTAARLAAIAADAVPDGRVPDNVRRELLASTQVMSVAIKRDERRRMVLPPAEPIVPDARFRIHMPDNAGLLAKAESRLGLIGDALAVFLRFNDRIILVYGHPEMGMGRPAPAASGATAMAPTGSALAATEAEPVSETREFVEIVMSEAPLKAAMISYGLNILGLSVVISMIAAALVYFALNRALVQPMMRLSRSMLHFTQKPEDQSRIIVPSDRRDEIGVAERELARMQTDLSQLLNQKNRLAQLGLAVSKVNHDLRNMLAGAQLLSDRLSTLPDPTVQRFAPKLIASLDRAISFCNDTLRFGRAEEAAPRREVFPVRALAEEVGDELGLPRETLGYVLEVDAGVLVDADRGHLHRVLNNVVRNAVQALEMAAVAGAMIRISGERVGRCTRIQVSDNGPGVPARAREHLFEAFHGSTRKGGTGLGLAISAELVAAHGGRLSLAESTAGACFLIEIPDRLTALAAS
ncbi:MAG: HAMP domain-containing sensor histidine kinase [Hyphomicrobiaceae bacterium]